MRVTTVDNDIAGGEEGQEGSNEVIHSRASLDEEHDAAGRLKLLAEVLDRLCADNGLAY